MRRSVRFGAVAVVAAVVATGCQGSDGGQAAPPPAATGGTPAAAPTTGSGKPAPSGSASASAPGAPAPVAIPEAVDVLTLPETTEVKGLVLSQVVNPSKKNESCVLLTLAPDGRLARLRTFVTGDGSTPPGSRITPGCTERSGFTRDFTGMIGRTSFNFKDPVNSGDPHLSLLGTGGPTDLKDISGVGGAPGLTQDGMRVDPVTGEIVHWNGPRNSSTKFRLRAVRPDGTGERLLDAPGLRPTESPAFLGGRMVGTKTAERAASRADGSLAVFADDQSKVHVGPVATLETNPVAEVVGSGSFLPRAFVGPDEVLGGSARLPVAVTLDVSDPARPRATVRQLGPVPPALHGSGTQEELFVAAPGERAAYTLVHQGEDKLGRKARYLVLRLDLATGAVTVPAVLTGTGGRAVPLEYAR